MADFVLMHGTTQGPNGWDRLILELTKSGHRSTAVDLAAAPAKTSGELVRVVKSQVPDDFHAPVVVAHSGTGPLIPSICRELQASHAVWLAALVPDRDATLQQEIESAPTSIFSHEWIGENPTTDVPAAIYFLFHDCDLETLRWALSTVRLFAPAFLYANNSPALTELPSTYIAGIHDRVIQPSWSRRAAHSRLGANYITLDSGHCPHVSRPVEVATILNDLTA